ncbi:DUF2254 family protein [Arthrobacter burdickii]|uniref:DUF2254 family protein n=1 Tax=Arthrobacter burdickii TaxID=3035920 RepID=A0ABT8JZN0_9MICC|nr:DUF2254 family protein [Arthrobacter burdickii]MDN4610631.1 DUF2254 family protein [Arthrobacter burdickii]
MLADSPGVGHDPLRSSGGLHEANRFQRGVAEFLRLPLVVTAAFCLVAVGVSLLDRLTSDDAGVRTVVRSIVSEEGAVDFLAAVATSLLTVTSITFSVLLLAVQQTASSLTPVVFDQFLRRTSNQLYFGFFIGATAFSFLVLGLARQQPAPLYSAALTLVLAVAALVVLLMLIHSTIDQMRPESVVRSIHELALRAREVELKMLGRTRMARHSDPDEPEREVHAMDTGFVVTVDTEKLGQIAAAAGDDVEVIVEGRLGEYLVFDDLLVRLVGVGPEDSSYDEEVISAFGIDDIRDVNVESGYALDQLENIAWETGTSASQSPQTASTAVRTLSDLLGRWLIAGERDRSDRSIARDELPVVYTDGAVERGMVALSTLLVGASESRQAQTTAKILHSFARLLPRLQDTDRPAFDQALDAALPAVIQQAEIPPLRDALAELEKVMDRHGHDTERVRLTRDLLREATVRMMPKPSDEPEAANPRR